MVLSASQKGEKMVKMKKFISTMIIILILLWLGFTIWANWRICPQPGEVTTDTIYVYKTDTIREIVKLIEVKDTIIYRNIPTNVDTLAILKDYFAIRAYERYIDRDKLKLWVKDSITQNRIVWNEVEYEMYTDTVFRDITRTETIYKKGFYGNVSLSTNVISTGVSYLNKKGWMYGIGLNLHENKLTPYISISKSLSN
jgi:hypothetical protein